MSDNLRLHTLESNLRRAKDEKIRYTKLQNKLKSFPTSPNLNDLRELRKAGLECTVVNRDWRYGVINSTVLKNVAKVVGDVCTRVLSEVEPRIKEYEAEIATLKAKEKERKKVAKSSKKLLAYLDKYLDSNPNSFSQRELDCLIALIEDGTLRTVADLAPYGVVNK